MKNLDVASEQLAAISRLFSSTVIHEMARKGKSPLFSRLANNSCLLRSIPTASGVCGFFEKAFSLLRREGFRD
jgi:hypothetical protein